ncbi:MAG: 16S rRNA pseudouridine(516) synthase [Pseudomonadota bacterium]|nr:16S rRNA pseudouridine(516) synthase [Pseudomonadota bacterium]
MQLLRILQSQGFGVRRACRELIETGHIQVNGVVVEEPDFECDTPDLTLTLDGQDWRYREKVYLALHKPAGFECSRQAQHHPSVFSLLPEPLLLRGVQPVGRLDQDSTGLLLLSDDGDFIHRYTSPKKEVGKRYRVVCKHPVSEEQIAALLAGVLLRDEPAPLAARACTRVSENVIDLGIAEGKYHQVKRMLAAAGNRVEALCRTQVGGYALPDDLAPREWRFLEEEDLARLAEST